MIFMIPAEPSNDHESNQRYTKGNVDMIFMIPAEPSNDHESNRRYIKENNLNN